MNHLSSHAAGPFAPLPSIIKALSAGFALACAAQTAQAQEPPRNLLSLGAISLPEFEGSADRAIQPFVLGRLDFGQYGALRLAGLTAQYNVMGAKSPWGFGPVVSLRPARGNDVEDHVVRLLRKVDSTVEAGAFVDYRFQDTLTKGDQLLVGIEAKGGNGNQVIVGALYQGARIGAFNYAFDLRMTYADNKHMETYFSVDADNSARSGLPTYVASSGLKSVAVGVNASYDLSRQWTVIGRLGFTRLAGDARDSPIVRLRGDANATAVGVAIGYRF